MHNLLVQTSLWGAGQWKQVLVIVDFDALLKKPEAMNKKRFEILHGYKLNRKKNVAAHL